MSTDFQSKAKKILYVCCVRPYFPSCLLSSKIVRHMRNYWVFYTFLMSIYLVVFWDNSGWIDTLTKLAFVEHCCKLMVIQMIWMIVFDSRAMYNLSHAILDVYLFMQKTVSLKDRWMEILSQQLNSKDSHTI